MITCIGIYILGFIYALVYRIPKEYDEMIEEYKDDWRIDIAKLGKNFTIVIMSIFWPILVLITMLSSIAFTVWYIITGEELEDYGEE